MIHSPPTTTAAWEPLLGLPPFLSGIFIPLTDHSDSRPPSDSLPSLGGIRDGSNKPEPENFNPKAAATNK